MTELHIPTELEGVVLRYLDDEEYLALQESLDSPIIEVELSDSDPQEVPATLELRKIVAGLAPWLVQVGIFDRNIIVGGASLIPSPKEPELAEIGYSIISNYRRQGYATAAVKALVEFGIRQRGVELVVATIEASNLPSQQLISKLGFLLFDKKEDKLFFGYTETLWQPHN